MLGGSAGIREAGETARFTVLGRHGPPRIFSHSPVSTPRRRDRYSRGLVTFLSLPVRPRRSFPISGIGF